ncbi:hypothetical protein JOD45_001930 [Scopulibacillus daqui]|uniref:Uncharacterized protein n=1 Tax=Scopulibacillus daqui TaxID=1469162 RepID=A0ABS2Q0Q2_9BACL|nr:hypothetical protein [Scopulibacillus daqui]MBM7645711.1 hypothetical protein [Scopulibacillus daqui]
MKRIVSFKVSTPQVKLVDLIDFYFYSMNAGQTIYLFYKGRTCKIERMTELICFFLTAEEREMLVIVEGPHAKRWMKTLRYYMHARNMFKKIG